MRVWPRCIVLLAAAALSLADAAAQSRPEQVEPGNFGPVLIGRGWDRSTPPASIEVLPLKVAGHRWDGTGGHGALFFTCRSRSDSAYGRCATEDTGDDAAGTGSRVAVRFTERRSGTRVEIDVVGALRRIDASDRCHSSYWSQQPRPLSTSKSSLCVGSGPVGTGVELEIQADQLQRLVAGKWSATLELALNTPAQHALAVYTFMFDFTITDRDAVAIYFPEFDRTRPSVGLNLRYDPITDQLDGRSRLDMCLYDGLGSLSDYLDITVRDTGTQPPPDGHFSVWHQDGGHSVRDRLDYTVTLDHAGAGLVLRNGVTQQLSGIDVARLRLVLLPGMNQPVYCVPTPLTFNTPSFLVTDKLPGFYSGGLKVEMTVPASNP